MAGDLLFEPNLWSPTLTALQAISSLALFFVVYTIYGDKSLRKHPATIIGVICGMNAVYCFSNLSKSLICPGNAEVLYAYTVYFNTSEKSLHRAMGTMTYAWLFLLVFFFEATRILFNCFLYSRGLPLSVVVNSWALFEKSGPMSKLPSMLKKGGG